MFFHRKRVLRVFMLCTVLLPLFLHAEYVPIYELSYVDGSYNRLYESTIASKNRLLMKERLSDYTTPNIYSYTLQSGEDIWTLVARTSLTIDTIATLNGIDFIGDLKEGRVVYLPDTQGIFLDADTNTLEEIEGKYGLGEQEVLRIPSPLDQSRTLLYLPEVQLPFVERTYLTGVVFYSPLMGIETSQYGERVDPFVNDLAFHGGVDIATDEGKKVHASRWGKIVFADLSNGYGNLVVIRHEYGYYTLYGHLGEILVEVDDNVESGQIVGTVGTTGRTTGPHLHFEIRRSGNTLNPDGIPFFLDHL
jgi:murein DD-endopeptidase MepM/ murein hydrolase activator NlpD